MNNLQQLKEQLRQAEIASAKAESDALLTEFRDALDGKCFLMQWHYRGGQAVAVARYSNFKIRQHTAPESICVEYHSEQATINISDSKKTRHVFEPAGIQRITNQYNIGTLLFDVTRNHVKEIPLNAFKTLWDEPSVLAMAHFDRWCRTLELSWKEPVTETPDSAFAVDVEFVTLSGSEISVCHGSPFLLPGYRHLVTPSAKAFVASRIREERERESRCSHLYEACDESYVNGWHHTMQSLTEKFKL